MKQIVLLIALATCFAFKAKAQTGATERTVVVDNSKMKVTEFLSQPGQDVCGKGVHSHPAHLTVLITDATVTITKAGKSITQKAPAGTSFWSDAETHEVVNSGKLPMKVLIIVSK